MVEAFFTKAAEAVGRMAFTNYLCESMICSISFYPNGFECLTYSSKSV
ncbi:DUF418 domain-containing protein [Labilibaculum sp.]